MKKIISAVLLAGAMLVALTACDTSGSNSTPSPAANGETQTTPGGGQNNGPDGGDWVIAYITKDLTQQWFIDEGNEIERVALAMGAASVIQLDAGMDPERYMTHLDNVIAQGVDMIIVCPPDQQLSQMTVDRVSAAGIPIIAVDDALIDADGNVLAPVVELSAFDVGRQQGEWLGAYFNDNLSGQDPSEVGYMVMTMNEVSSTVQRHLGAQEAFGETAVGFDMNNMIEANYDGTTERGYEVAMATITANPHIRFWMITAPNEEGAVGATRALEQAGVDRDAVVVGAGAYHAKDEFKKEYSAMKAAVYFDARVAGEAVASEAMNFLIHGTEMCGDFRVPGQNFGRRPFAGILVTPENYMEIMGEAAF